MDAGFGSAVALSSTHLVVAASLAQSAFVYKKDGSGNFPNVTTSSIIAYTGKSGFGCALALSATHLVVGASGTKKAFVFRIGSSGTIPGTATTVLGGYTGEAGFGGAVALSETLLVVSASTANKVFAFTKDESGNFPTTASSISTSGESGFGAAVALFSSVSGSQLAAIASISNVNIAQAKPTSQLNTYTARRRRHPASLAVDGITDPQHLRRRMSESCAKGHNIMNPPIDYWWWRVDLLSSVAVRNVQVYQGSMVVENDAGIKGYNDGAMVKVGDSPSYDNATLCGTINLEPPLVNMYDVACGGKQGRYVFIVSRRNPAMHGTALLCEVKVFKFAAGGTAYSFHQPMIPTKSGMIATSYGPGWQGWPLNQPETPKTATWTSAASPACQDYDSDGDIDCIVGRADGSLIYWESHGISKATGVANLTNHNQEPLAPYGGQIDETTGACSGAPQVCAPFATPGLNWTADCKPDATRLNSTGVGGCKKDTTYAKTLWACCGGLVADQTFARPTAVDIDNDGDFGNLARILYFFSDYKFV